MKEATVTERDESAGRVIEESVEIAAPIEAVWKALTDADELTRWFPLDARVKPGPGGSIWMSWRNEYQWDIPIEVWDPPRRLRLAYAVPAGTAAKAGATKPGSPHSGTAEASAGPSPEADPSFGLHVAIDYHLETRGGHTFVRLVHSGFGAGAGWDAELDATRRGWRFELGSLQHYLERHRGTPREVVYARAKIDLPREEAWKRLMGPDGLRVRAGGLVPGSRYALSTAAGQVIEGTVLSFEPPKEFTAIAENLNDALLRFTLDDLPLRRVRDVTVWIGLYGLPRDVVAGLRAGFDELLLKLYLGSEQAGA